MDSAAMAQVKALLDRAITEAADEAANVMSENIMRGARSGRWYPWYEARSSAPGEFPQEQSGQLISKVDSRFVEESLAEVGVYDEDPQKLVKLEFHEDERGGRPFISTTMEDPDTHKQMNDRIKGMS